MSSVRRTLLVSALIWGSSMIPGGAGHAAQPWECAPGKNDYLEHFFAPSKKKGHVNHVHGGGACGVSALPGSVRRAELLTAELNEIARPLLEGNRPRLSRACIRYAMERRPNPASSWFYGSCAKGKGSPSKRVPPPCVSDHLIDYTWQSMMEAFDCIGEDPREVYGLFSKESSFMPNIGNTANAFGVGQVTRVASLSVDREDWFKPHRGKKACAKFATLMERKRNPRALEPCELIQMPENPAKNFLYAAVIFKHMKKRAEAYFPDRGVKMPNAANRELIERDLAFTMYNGGDGAVGACFQNYLVDHPDGIASYEKFKTEFPLYLGENYGEGVAYFERFTDSGKVTKRKEVAAYAQALNSLTEEASNSTGWECGRWKVGR